MQHGSIQQAIRFNDSHDGRCTTPARAAIEWVDERGALVRLLSSSSTTRLTASHPSLRADCSLGGQIA